VFLGHNFEDWGVFFINFILLPGEPELPEDREVMEYSILISGDFYLIDVRFFWVPVLLTSVTRRSLQGDCAWSILLKRSYRLWLHFAQD
jgi:hypothetical protein